MTTKTTDIEMMCYTLKDQLESITNQFGYAWPGVYHSECQEAIDRADALLQQLERERRAAIVASRPADINDDPFWDGYDAARVQGPSKPPGGILTQAGAAYMQGYLLAADVNQDEQRDLLDKPQQIGYDGCS